MPTISMFYGILVSMYLLDTKNIIRRISMFVMRNSMFQSKSRQERFWRGRCQSNK